MQIIYSIAQNEIMYHKLSKYRENVTWVIRHFVLCSTACPNKNDHKSGIALPQTRASGSDHIFEFSGVRRNVK